MTRLITDQSQGGFTTPTVATVLFIRRRGGSQNQLRPTLDWRSRKFAQDQACALTHPFEGAVIVVDDHQGGLLPSPEARTSAHHATRAMPENAGQVMRLLLGCRQPDTDLWIGRSVGQRLWCECRCSRFNVCHYLTEARMKKMEWPSTRRLKTVEVHTSWSSPAAGAGAPRLNFALTSRRK